MLDLIVWMFNWHGEIVCEWREFLWINGAREKWTREENLRKYDMGIGII